MREKKNDLSLMSERGFCKTVAAVFILISVVTFAVFYPALDNSLLAWDDSGYIIENQHIKSFSIEMLRWAFGQFYLNYWAPLTWVSLAFDYAIWGADPFGYHLTNNVLHALNAGVFFLLCFELLTLRSSASRVEKTPALSFSRNQIVFCSTFAAALFAIHPLRVESVAWAAERKDVLSFFFGVPAAIAYLRYIHATVNSSGDMKTFWLSPYYWLSLILFFLSLLSKSLVITLPLVLLIIDWLLLRRIDKRTLVAVLLEKIPYFFLAGGAALLTMKAQELAIRSFAELSLITRVLVAFKSVAAYLMLTVCPFVLSPFYVHPMNIVSVSFEYILAILLFIFITIGCLLLLKRSTIFVSAWLVYLITLLPFLGLTQVGPQAMAGRFTYLSGLPLALLFALGITAVFVKYSGSLSARLLLIIGVILIIAVNAYLTVREISFWKDDITLWTRVIELQPHHSGRAYYQRSDAYLAAGNYQKALQDINEALAIAIQKNYRSLHEIYGTRAVVFTRMGNYNAAIADYSDALKTADFMEQSKLLRKRGEVYRLSGNFAMAAEDLRRAAGQ